MGDNFRESASDERLRQYDSYAHAITVIQEPHRMAHDGFMHSVTAKFAALADTASLELLLTVPAGVYPHLNKWRSSFGRGDIDIVGYEAPTVSDVGTAMPSLNTNRNSSRVPGMTVSHTPTTSADGSLIHTIWVPPTGTGTGQSANGVANVEAGEEWILPASTQYLWRITNNSGATIPVSFDLIWYEIAYES